LDPFWLEATRDNAGGSFGSRGEYTLLSVARIDANEQYKGVDQVIRALPQVTAQVGDVRYVIAGDGTDRPRLENLAQSLGVSDKVQFLGHVVPDALKQLYAECDVFVMPSEKEGFGIVFLEAMSCGKPVIGGRHGGTPEIIVEGETGLLVDHHNLPELAEAIICLLRDDKARSRMGKAGLERLQERFTYSAFRDQFFAVLESRLMHASV
jgi:glycosyltransferase involved in cell wall biosynthesis